jgi:hypothetical protein
VSNVSSQSLVDEPPNGEGEDNTVISRHRTSSDATTTGVASSLAISPERKPELVLPVGLSAPSLQLEGWFTPRSQIPKSTARSLLPSAVRAVISPALTEGAIRILHCTLLMAKVNALYVYRITLYSQFHVDYYPHSSCTPHPLFRSTIYDHLSGICIGNH